MRRRWSLAAAGATAYGLSLYLGRTWGSTREERRQRLPSDDLIPDPHLVTNHAITIHGHPGDVWPWLIQMGWHRGGWYTYRWVDRLLFPANAPSTDRILPEFQDLSVGDRIPDGPPETECYFTVEIMEPEQLLVLHSTSHLPPWPPDRWLDWVWTYALRDMGDGRTRILLRARTALGPPILAWGYSAMLWMDLVMARSHLRGLRSRVETRVGAGDPFSSR
jgi:hypothetical protein